MSKENKSKKQNLDVGDFHIDFRLQDSHSEAPNEITEKQLDKYHFEVDDLLTEKQLEKSREKASTTAGTTEALLNNQKAKFDIKLRNEDASKGDINKLEEQRLAGEKQEDEKYDPASSTPKDLRWWEGHKSPDGLKIASNKKKIIVQAIAPYDFEEEEENEVRDAVFDLEVNPGDFLEDVINKFTVIQDDSDETGRTITLRFDEPDPNYTKTELETAATIKAQETYPEFKDVINIDESEASTDNPSVVEV